jgi:hypothetical protein
MRVENGKGIRGGAMSDELTRNEESEVEGHVKKNVAFEPAAESDDESDVEAHVRKANIRMDAPSHI